MRAARRSRRRHPGVALPPREDGRADHRHEAGHRRLGGAGYLRTTLGQNLFPDLWEIRTRAVNPLARRTTRASASPSAAADRPFAPGVARRGVRGAAAGVARRRGVRRRQVGARRGAGATTCARDSPGCSATPRANIALGQNTHELVTRWLSALPLRDRRRSSRPTANSTPSGGSSIASPRSGSSRSSRIPARPADTLAERLPRAVDDRTACVLVSSVLYETAEIVPELDRVAAACARARRRAARRCLPPAQRRSVRHRALMGLADAFVTGGGYKYCQLGEGNCFPARAAGLPPAAGAHRLVRGVRGAGTGARESPGAVRRRRGTAFAGATYDPTSHYRAAAVFAFPRSSRG